MSETVAFRLNGAEVGVAAAPDSTLLSALRGPLGLAGPRFGCGAAQCGACFVLLDGAAVPACATGLAAASGREVVTVEGLGTPDAPHPLQAAFLAEGALQCGYCVPGILIAAAALLRRDPDPDDAAIRTALDGNLCRCGAHNRMVRAVLRAAAALRSDAREQAA